MQRQWSCRCFVSTSKRVLLCGSCAVSQYWCCVLLLCRIAPTAVEKLPADGGASVCTASAFSVDGLAAALKRAINYMTKADLFEYALQLTKALQPIYEQRRQYQSLALMYKNSAGLLKQVRRCLLYTSPSPRD